MSIPRIESPLPLTHLGREDREEGEGSKLIRRSGRMRSSTTLLAISMLLPFLVVINPSQASTSQNAAGGALHGGIPPTVDLFDKLNFSERLIPALYVFGDSLLDSGNNNFIPGAIAIAYKTGYGCSFFNRSTGRFTDGRTAADFVAQISGLPYPPPYLGVKQEGKPFPTTGLNFASASSGILPQTGNASLGICLNADKQVELFREATKELSKQFKNEDELSQHLSKSIFYLSMGRNDYSKTLWPAPKPSNETLKSLAPVLLQKLVSNLKELYAMGARKFLVHNITPKDFVGNYNRLLPGALTKLQAELPGSKFVTVDAFKIAFDIIMSPAKFHITETIKGCYDGHGGPVCKDVDSHLLFDNGHPTQTVHYLTVRRCIEESAICAPMTLDKLIAA